MKRASITLVMYIIADYNMIYMLWYNIFSIAIPSCIILYDMKLLSIPLILVNCDQS